MKSLTAVCQTAGASGMPALNPSGRITRHPPHRGDGENAEMKMYLSKLKDLVPFMPKNRKLSKLEIIQHVIDYICDLQTELETHPEIGNFDAAAALTSVALHRDDDSDMEDDEAEEIDSDADVLAQRLAAEQPAKVSSPAARLPLSDRQTPNTLVAPPAQQQQNQQLPQQPAQQLTNSLSTQSNAEKDSRQS
ncbi:protein extra-macrochaetae [Drosophila bipectinata]|uniref:protein extra-macrochaetae n=1 Tax=Drosophila bipectinata TaxID=42026 RepID=UPI001C890177|nr:protein extra-macrochaetae [Drosophila bipectinata]